VCFRYVPKVKFAGQSIQMFQPEHSNIQSENRTARIAYAGGTIPRVFRTVAVAVIMV